MSRLLLGALLVVGMIGCASPRRYVEPYGGALEATLGGGIPRIESSTNEYYMVSHTCVSSPIFDIYGDYVRTEVRCQ